MQVIANNDTVEFFLVGNCSGEVSLIFTTADTTAVTA